MDIKLVKQEEEKLDQESIKYTFTLQPFDWIGNNSIED